MPRIAWLLALVALLALAAAFGVSAPRAKADTNIFVPVPCGSPEAVGCITGPPPRHAPLQP